MFLSINHVLSSKFCVMILTCIAFQWCKKQWQQIPVGNIVLCRSCNRTTIYTWKM